MRVLAFVMLLAACDAYDQDVGRTPFFCGTETPRCPEGYTCATDPNNGDELCVPDGSSSIGIQCADDSAIEPNETLATATHLAGMGELAICPATDKDTFTVTVANGGAIDVTVEIGRGGTLRAAILNAGGVPLSTAAFDDATRRLSASRDGLEAGTYFVQVSSLDGHPNNYTLAIQTR